MIFILGREVAANSYMDIDALQISGTFLGGPGSVFKGSVNDLHLSISGSSLGRLVRNNQRYEQRHSFGIP